MATNTTISSQASQAAQDWFILHRNWSGQVEVYTSTWQVIRSAAQFVRLCSGQGFSFVCDRKTWLAKGGRVTQLE